jgi:hypothetical protein
MLREQQQIEEQRIREIRVDEAPAAQPETDGDQTGTAQPEPADAEQAQ